ncbi:hypothetical protein D3C72_1365420 [compost metagenome]
MNHDFWLEALMDDAKRRRRYQCSLLAARHQPRRPLTTIKDLLKALRIVRALENQSAAGLRRSHLRGAV